MRQSKLCAMALLLLATACAPMEPSFKPVDVDIPVAETVKVADIAAPDFATFHVSPKDNVGIKMRACVVELDQRKAYEALLTGELNGFR